MEIKKHLSVLLAFACVAGLHGAPADEGAKISLSSKKAAGRVPAQLADHVTSLGTLEICLLEGGYYEGEQGFYPVARLLFKNMDLKKRVHKTISVEFFERISGKRLSISKTFLSLKPGQQFERSYAQPRGAAWASLEVTPDINVFVKDKGLSTGAMALVRRPLFSQ